MYKRIISGADNAVLLIHGIIGTPNHFLPFMPFIPDTYSVWNILLDGHGGNVRDFSSTSMAKWANQISAAVDELSISHKRIYIVAHSMGTLLAIEEAIRSPKVCCLFLLAVPLKIHLRWQMIKNCAKIYLNIIEKDDILGNAAKDSCGVKLSRNPFLYLGWIPRYLELFQKISQVRKLLPRLTTPCTAFQSHYDEMVSNQATALLKKHPNIDVSALTRSTHFYYEPRELEDLQNAFVNMIKQER